MSCITGDCFGVKEPDCENTYQDCECILKDQSSDCILYTGKNLETIKVKKGSILTDSLIKINSFLRDLKAYVERYYSLINTGEGVSIIKGRNAVEQLEIKTLKGSGSVTISDSNNKDEVVVHTPYIIDYKGRNLSYPSLYKDIEKIDDTHSNFIFRGIKGDGISVFEKEDHIELGITKNKIEEISDTVIGDINRKNTFVRTINNEAPTSNGNLELDVTSITSTTLTVTNHQQRFTIELGDDIANSPIISDILVRLGELENK